MSDGYVLYYVPGSCSLSPHIALREAGAAFTLDKVDLRNKTLASGDDWRTINPKNYVPALRIPGGEVLTEGAVADNFEIYSQTISPLTVLVRGPESVVKSLDFILTEKIGLESQQTDFTVLRVPLNIINPEVRSLDTTVVDVAFHVGEKRVERMFIVPVQSERKRATVILFGGRSLIESLKAEDLRVENIKKEAGESSLKLDLPVDVQNKVEVRKLK